MHADSASSLAVSLAGLIVASVLGRSSLAELSEAILPAQRVGFSPTLRVFSAYKRACC